MPKTKAASMWAESQELLLGEVARQSIHSYTWTYVWQRQSRQPRTSCTLEWWRFWAEQGLMPPLIPQGICSAPLALRMPFLRARYCPIIESKVFSSELSIKSPATAEFSPGRSAKECLLILLRCSTSFQIPLDLRFSSGFLRLLWQYPGLGFCSEVRWSVAIIQAG